MGKGHHLAWAPADHQVATLANLSSFIGIGGRCASVRSLKLKIGLVHFRLSVVTHAVTL
jgi:hypothetical protein